MSEETINSIDKFERIYRDWHAARAAAYDPDDERRGSMLALNTAEMALMTAPAPLPWAVFHKWELLDFMMTNEAESGPYTDNRVIVALASIKADVLRFGMKNP